MKRTLALLLCTGLTLSLFACEQESTPQTPTPSATPTTWTGDLRQATGLTDFDAVGVTIEPNTGRLLVLDSQRGIFEINREKEISQIWSVGDLSRYGVEVRSEFTDIVALEEGVFALTALSDGFLLDMNQGTMVQHFCYEPGWEEFPPPAPIVAQITDSVTYDVQNNLIYAQPRSVTDNLEEVIDSSLALYDRQTGQDLNWTVLDSTYRAGGMAMQDQDTLLLGVGSKLDRYSIPNGQMETVLDLSTFGVQRVQGMAFDPDAGSIFVVDGPSQKLFEISLDEME